MPQEIRTYKSAKDFEKDAKRRMKKGWVVTSQSDGGNTPGIGRVAMLGPLAFLFRPKRTITAIYSKDS